MRNGAKMFFGGIKIIGNDNEVVYDGCKAMINVFMKGNGCKITVGRGSLIDESTSIVLMGQGNREIGEECMFAEKVEIWGIRYPPYHRPARQSFKPPRNQSS